MYHKQLGPTERDPILISDLVSKCGLQSLMRGWPLAVYFIQWPHVPLLKNGGPSPNAITCMAKVTHVLAEMKSAWTCRCGGNQALQMGAGVWLCRLLALWPCGSYLTTGRSVSKAVNWYLSYRMLCRLTEIEHKFCLSCAWHQRCPQYTAASSILNTKVCVSAILPSSQIA